MNTTTEKKNKSEVEILAGEIGTILLALKEESNNILTYKALGKYLDYSPVMLTRAKDTDSGQIKILHRRDIHAKLKEIHVSFVEDKEVAISKILNKENGAVPEPVIAHSADVDADVAETESISKQRFTPALTLSSLSLPYLMSLGGILAGFITGLIMILNKIMGGYFNLGDDKRYYIAPFIMFSFMGIGWVMGYFGGKTIQKIIGETEERKKRKHKIILFLLCFALSIPLRGMKARDSFFVQGIDDGSGLFGEPNFEVLATGLAVASATLVIVLDLLRLGKIASWNENLLIATKSTVAAVLAFLAVYVVFFLLTHVFHLFELNAVIGSAAFFQNSFSHPERIGITGIMAFLYAYFIVGLPYLKSMENK